MRKDEEIKEIITYLSNWNSQIKLNNCLNYFDINILSEDLIKRILSKLYSLEYLVNLNEQKVNFPGIDLGDETNKVCFQVSSSFTTEKIRSTLNTYLDIGRPNNEKLNLKLKYPMLYFVFLTEEKIDLSKTEIINIKKIDPNFEYISQIITFAEILKKIEKIYSIDYHSFRIIKETLLLEFGHLDIRKKQCNFYIIDKNKTSLNTHLNKYLNSHKNKFILTKTFLHRQEVKFSDVYSPLSIKDDKQVIKISSINQLFGKAQKSYLSITGNAGSGKSTLVKFLFLNCIETYYAVPVLVELRKLNNSKTSLFNHILEILFNQTKQEDVIDNFLNSGNLLFIFDGYDEINHHNRERILSEIEHLTDTYSNNKFILTSRPGVNIESFYRYKNYSMCELKISELDEFISKQIIIYSEDEELVKKEKFELRSKILSKIKSQGNTQFSEFFTSPLLLSMFILTFEQYPDIPKTKTKFYLNVFETLYQKHDAFTKNSWEREKRASLEQSDYEIILEKFSFKAFKESKINFPKKYFLETVETIKQKIIRKEFENSHLLNDLIVAIPILTEDGFEEFCFVHKSLMEYFAANAIHNSTPENKLKLYTSFVKEKFKVTQDLNFCSICKELDPTLFNENVLLPLLNEAQAQLTNNNKSENAEYILLNFLKMIKLAFIIDDNEEEIRSFIHHSHFISSIFLILQKEDPIDSLSKAVISTDFFSPLIEKFSKYIKDASESEYFLSSKTRVLTLNTLPEEELLKYIESNISLIKSNPSQFKTFLLILTEIRDKILEELKLIKTNEIDFFELD